MKQSEINSILKACHSAAGELSCEEALSVSGYAGKKKLTGNSLFFECPNGCDHKKKLDKCAINVDSNFAHCFCCGEGWNPTKLMASIWKVPYNQAALLYGKSVGAISEEQYKEIAANEANFSKAMKGTVPIKKAEQKAIEESEFKRPAKDLDLVYRNLLKLPQFTLSESHRKYLQTERRLSDEDISNVGFFSYEENFSMAELTTLIQKEQSRFNPKKDYWGVPGFCFEFKDETKTSGRWTFHKPYMDCIGIPIRDEEGQIIALQMRALSKKASVKYFFVSSKIKQDEKNIKGYGSTPSTPASVVYPAEIINPYVYIGEGMFKMLEVAKSEGSIAVSVQGVNNTKEVPGIIKSMLLSETAKSKAPRINGKHLRMQIVIVYDADIYKNHGVISAAQTLVKGLKKEFPSVNVSFLIWDLNLGKGFDDLKYYAKENGLDYHALCKVIPAQTFVDLSEHCLNNATGGKRSKKLMSTPEFAGKLYGEMWTKNLSRFFQ